MTDKTKKPKPRTEEEILMACEASDMCSIGKVEHIYDRIKSKTNHLSDYCHGPITSLMIDLVQVVNLELEWNALDTKKFEEGRDDEGTLPIYKDVWEVGEWANTLYMLVLKPDDIPTETLYGKKKSKEIYDLGNYYNLVGMVKHLLQKVRHLMVGPSPFLNNDSLKTVEGALEQILKLNEVRISMDEIDYSVVMQGRDNIRKIKAKYKGVE